MQVWADWVPHRVQHKVNSFAPCQFCGRYEVAITRDQALASSPRLKIETPELQGSINLAGAQLDDLHLTQYRETIDPKSPTIVLLSPAERATAAMYWKPDCLEVP